MRIYQNVAAYNSQRLLSNTNVALGKNLEKLSSGLRINRAADDAAGLVISENLRAQVSSMKVSIRNAQDGVSIAQTADGQYEEVSTMLRRMRDLAMQSMNGTNDAIARTALDNEFQQLKQTITQIGNSSRFGDVNLFSGIGSTNFQSGVTFQVGFAAADTIVISFSAMNTGSVAALTSGATQSIANYASASAALAIIDGAIDNVSASRGRLGAFQNRFESVVRALGVTVENLAASESRIRDTDMAEETTLYTRNQILQQSGMAMLSQANSLPQSALSLLR
jgi:flagellin